MTARSKSNPFAQSAEHHTVVFSLPEIAARTADDAFDDITLAVSGFETDEAKHIWTFTLLFDSKPDMEEIKRRLIVLSTLHEFPLPEVKLTVLEKQDWLKQVAQDFPPLSIGRFYVHGSHVKDSPPSGAIPIQVDAGAAFGSGEHGTTSACMEAMDWLAKSRSFKHVLDMGCGSGLLAIAAAKLWKADVLAVDIDPVAVQVTGANVLTNRGQKHISAAVSDGYASDAVKRGAPYDLILSNILARPLVKFAPDLVKNLAPKGVAILSGLLVSQEKQVLSAHIMQGLKLKKRFVRGEWCTLVLGR